VAVPQSGPQALGEERERVREADIPLSLLSICFLFAVERKGDKPFVRNGWRVKEEASLHRSQSPL